jgi:hypothetical protein
MFDSPGLGEAAIELQRREEKPYMICPFMTRPIVYSTVESGGDSVTELFEVVCRREGCAMWERRAHIPHCGMRG